MKKTIIVLAVLLVGCAGTETRRYEIGPSYHIKDGFLQPVHPNQSANQADTEVTSAKRPTEMPARIPKTPGLAAVPPTFESTREKRSSKRVQEQVKRIRKILENTP